MLDQTAIALAGTAARRMQAVSRFEDRVVRTRRRFVRRDRAAAPAVPHLAAELALQC